jgi:hypothetical protein
MSTMRKVTRCLRINGCPCYNYFKSNGCLPVPYKDYRICFQQGTDEYRKYMHEPTPPPKWWQNRPFTL